MPSLPQFPNKSFANYFNCTNDWNFSFILYKVQKIFFKKIEIIKIRMNFNQLNQLQNSSFAIKKMIIASSLKIFMNYSQTITILNSLKLNWEGQLLNVFNIHKAASGGFQEVVSFECLFTGICINYSVFFF